MSDNINLKLINRLAIESELKYKELPVDEKVTWLEAYQHFMEIIERTPAAYDLESVFKQLEELTSEECTLHECGVRSEKCKACIAKKALEIVKNGVIDEKAEWVMI